MDQHLGSGQRWIRRGRLQAERHRPPEGSASDQRFPGGQDRRPRRPALPWLTGTMAHRRALCLPCPLRLLPVAAVRREVSYQFLDDTSATASSLGKDGFWTVHTEPGAEPLGA